jgi:hypothetical protein
VVALAIPARDDGLREWRGGRRSRFGHDDLDQWRGPERGAAHYCHTFEHLPTTYMTRGLDESVVTFFRGEVVLAVTQVPLGVRD